MTMIRTLVLALAVTGASSVMVAEAALGDDAKAAQRDRRPRLVFLSPAPSQPGFVGGLTGADLVCRQAAEAQGLSGVFLAWLGDGALGPADRFEPERGPLVNVRGERVASGWRQLGNGSAEAPVLRLDGTVSQTAPWTNVHHDGRSGSAATACDRWWNAGRRHAGSIGVGRDDRQVGSCDTPRPFLCVQQ
jgi:hypothetical protein